MDIRIDAEHPSARQRKAPRSWNSLVRQLHRESVAVAALRTAIVDHEEIGHQLLTDAPVGRAAFLRQQDDISRQFNEVAKIFPTANGMKATVVQARCTTRSPVSQIGRR